MNNKKSIFDFLDLENMLDGIDLSLFKFNDESIDLTTKEGLDKFNKTLDELEKNEFGKLFLEHIIGKKVYEIRDLAKNYFDINNSKQAKIDNSLKDIKQEPKQLQRKKEKEEFDRPSKHIDVNVGLKIHKLVQEYVDTMIKPYSKGIMDKNSINNAYAGLYEFCCWIYNHK